MTGAEKTFIPSSGDVSCITITERGGSNSNNCKDPPVNDDHHMASDSMYPSPPTVGDSDNCPSGIKEETEQSIAAGSHSKGLLVNSESTPVVGKPTSQSEFPLDQDHSDEKSGRLVTSPRERKKSKYLSYPFIELGNQSIGGFTGSAKSEGNDIKKRGRPRQSGATRPSDDIIKEDDIIITASSAQLLVQLQLTAHDCLYPLSLEHNNEVFYQAQIFFTRFRTLLFHGLTISDVLGGDVHLSRCNGLEATDNKEDENLKEGAAIATPTATIPAQKLGRKRKEKATTITTDEEKNLSPSGLYDVSVNFSTNDVLNLAAARQVEPGSNGAKRGRKRKKEASSTLACVEEANQIAAAKEGTTTDGNNINQISLEVCLNAPNDPSSTVAAAAPTIVPPVLVECTSRAAAGVDDVAGSSTPSLQQMKQNLELMTSMLDKAGHNISLETRVKLETEIEGLLNKVSTMVAGPSSTAPIC